MAGTRSHQPKLQHLTAPRQEENTIGAGVHVRNLRADNSLPAKQDS